MSVINPPEKKLAKRTSVHCLEQKKKKNAQDSDLFEPSEKFFEMKPPLNLSKDNRTIIKTLPMYATFPKGYRIG